MVFAAVAVVIAAYFIGSVNFAVIFAKAFLKKDVRNLGSGNAGATNVMRTAGFLPGILTFVCDALKGFLASYLGKLVFWLVSASAGIDWLNPIYGAYLCGVACMLGHVFPIFFQFKGGKGAATSVGIYAVCCPLAIVLGLCAFALVLLTTKIVSLGSLAAALTVVVLSIVLFAGEGNIFVVAALSITMGIIVFAKHKDNIKRLIHGEEKKLTLGGKKNG